MGFVVEVEGGGEGEEMDAGVFFEYGVFGRIIG